ncbi:hypothetical protein [Oceanobacillus neutriphilus]|uniref:Phage protein n=1 Tax=Oceanobacillus neutriphilus TaxID=531815 RepID=A0ABQ2P289_9BACI|nr:hypothetical protein [Oceanobacillus neutriphilus]GGP16227.1 hypothetical protein GCM10011346_47360 [Oceanobacillus neutriphilus]
MSDIQIDIQRTGFPVKVGEIDLWFDSSHENLVHFFKLAEQVQKESEKSIEEMKNIEMPEDYLNDLSGAHQEGMKFIDYQKKQTAIEYDLMFGKGTFKKLYEKYPDYVSLQNALRAINEAIQERIVQQEEERAKEVDAKTEEVLRNKAKKQAKKK